MPDYYHVPALILTALLLPAFGHLYLRFRDTRTLLWFLGFLFALLSMVLLYPTGIRGLSGDPWLAAAGQTALQLSSALFLGSLLPQRFQFRHFQILYAVPYALILVVYSILLYGVCRGTPPSNPLSLIFPILAATGVALGLFWSGAGNAMPGRLSVLLCAVLGGWALGICLLIGPERALTFTESVNLFMTASLLCFVFRRFTPGVFLSVVGFLVWSLSFLQVIPWIGLHPGFGLDLIRSIAMGKVVAAVGMIVLALEDELNSNKVGRDRERRARRQLEAYTNLMLTRRRVEDFDRQGAEICETVVMKSRFSQAALLLESGGRYHLAGSAGLEAAITKPLAELIQRISVEGFLAPDTTPAIMEHSMTRRLDLSPWLLPGDDLERLRFTSVLAVPMWGRGSADGALLLRGLLAEDGSGRLDDAPRPDDLLPIEMLATRLQATRSQTMLFEKLIDSEKFAGLGQLAGNVTQQLNSPLTVILGYASLLEDSSTLDVQDRKGVASIVNEARRIRSTLESLSRVSRSHADQPAAVSVAELLADMEQLYRSEFLHRSIQFQVKVAPGLPRILCGAQQLRQAVLHCLQYAIGAVDRETPAAAQMESRIIRLEATREANLVQITISHSGQSFLYPERAFDPFVPSRAGGETAGMGLSLCASILRDQNGRASAVNLEPHGAAIVLELQAA